MKLVNLDMLSSKNPFGYQEVKILEFNYDGQGNALGLIDGKLESISLANLKTILFANDEDKRFFGLDE